MNEIKVEVDSHDVHQLCTGCLCATRTIRTLDDVTLKQYYMNILTETQLEAGEPVLLSPSLCWECVALLKRLVRFREQVQDSYRLLQLKLNKENLSEFVVSSVCRPGRLSTCRAYSIDISPQDGDTQLMTADEDHDDKSFAMNYLEIDMENLPSTSRETVDTVNDDFKSICDVNIGVCVSEDLDEQLEDSDAQTRKQDTSSVTTINTTNPTCDESTHELKRYECNLCPKAFAQKCRLVTHRRTLRQQYGEKPFQCEVCHKSFAVKGALIIHIRTHTGEKPFQCELCHSSYAVKGKLKRHINLKHQEKPYKCKICPKSYAQRYELSMHFKKLHTSSKNYECKICQQTLTSLAEFRKHKKTHLGQKVYRCQLCPKAYYRDWVLREHMRLHTGEKPFQCEFCAKGFIYNTTLQSHRKIHTGEKPFQCKVCLKTFRQSGTLKTHMRTHTGEKPYQCEVCGQAFSLKPGLLSHVKTHTGKKGSSSIASVKRV